MTYWDQYLHTDTPLFVGSNNRMPQAIFETPELRQMYLRRVRTLMDELLKPSPMGGQPKPAPLQVQVRTRGRALPSPRLHAAAAEAQYYEPRIDELAAQIAPDAALDNAKWNSHAWGNGSTAPSFPQPYAEAVAELRDSYLPERRRQLFNGLAPGASQIPGPQPAGAVVLITAIETSPSSGNLDEQYIQLRNPNTIAVDVSGWILSTDGNTQTPIFTFRGGTVIPAGGTLYVAASRPALPRPTSVSHRRPGPVRRRRLHRPAPRPEHDARLDRPPGRDGRGDLALSRMGFSPCGSLGVGRKKRHGLKPILQTSERLSGGIVEMRMVRDTHPTGHRPSVTCRVRTTHRFIVRYPCSQVIARHLTGSGFPSCA